MQGHAESRPQEFGERLQLIVSYGLRLIVVGEAVLSLFRQNWLVFFLAVGILILSFVPAWLVRSYRKILPVEIDFLFMSLLFASLFLGEVRAYYDRFWWWDAFLHTASGFTFGLLGFTLVYIMNGTGRVTLQLSPIFVGLFSFAFAEAIGVLWEIFEYGMDAGFGLNMQKSGLRDTMWDLIVNTIGAGIVSVFGIFYVRGEDSMFFERIVRRWMARRSG